MDLFTQKCVGALIGTFVGDALGMPFEGQSATQIKENYAPITKMYEARLGRGTYTDDTQMMIATARHLCQDQVIDRSRLSKEYLEAFDPERGYGSGTRQVFRMWQDGIPVDGAASRVFEGGSYGNGGAMRIAPVGVRFYHDPDHLRQAVDDVVSLTHAHPLGVGGAYLQARAISLMLTMEPPEAPFYPNHLDRSPAFGILKTLRDEIPERWNPDGLWDDRLRLVEELLAAHDHPPSPAMVARELGCSSVVHQSVPTALFCTLAHMPSFVDAVRYAVEIGGDTDTIGAMSGAQVGALHGVGHVPDPWWDALENGENGRDEVVRLGETLADTAPEEVHYEG